MQMSEVKLTIPTDILKKIADRLEYDGMIEGDEKDIEDLVLWHLIVVGTGHLCPEIQEEMMDSLNITELRRQ